MSLVKAKKSQEFHNWNNIIIYFIHIININQKKALSLISKIFLNDIFYL
jgi:hypothetical protein